MPRKPARSAGAFMGVQAGATRRNNSVEILVDVTLRQFLARLFDEGLIGRPADPIQFVPFIREDCSDVFDHLVKVELADTGPNDPALELWCQTTCYKGIRTEPNKVYEARETIIESLGLRRWLTAENRPFRTVHFTVGSSEYAYGWIPVAKKNSFDLSLFPAESAATLYSDLARIDRLSGSEDEFRKRVADATLKGSSAVARFVQKATDNLYAWFICQYPAKAMANGQAALIAELSLVGKNAAAAAIEAARGGGAGIKDRWVADDCDADPIMRRVKTRLMARNPFLSIAERALENWPKWVATNMVAGKKHSLRQYVEFLWQLPMPARLIARRVLLKIHTSEPVEYVQDVGVAGTSEHTLYTADHDKAQVKQIVERVSRNCVAGGIDSASELQHLLTGARGIGLVSQSVVHERRNGTTLLPTLTYLEEFFGGEFAIREFRDVDIPSPIAYYASFGTAVVRPYTGMKVLVDTPSGKPLAILKAKYFRQQEFARRVKEEAYSGLTTKFKYVNERFEERYANLPLLMFVDMAPLTRPPDYAIRRLISCGWKVFFSISDLHGYLRNLRSKSGAAS